MDTKARMKVETIIRSLDEASSGLINFMMTLRPTLRNEILQICGDHIEKARQAKERLEALLQERASRTTRVHSNVLGAANLSSHRRHRLPRRLVRASHFLAGVWVRDKFVGPEI